MRQPAKRFIFYIALLVIFTIVSNVVAARAGGLLLVSCSTGFGQEALKSAAKPCRAQPALVGRCFNVRGRLSLYNGAPTVRLWRAGTKRMLGVSASYSQPEYSNIPAEIEKLLEWDNEVWGNFLVCPFTLQKPNEMQMMCIESGKNIVVRKRH